MRKTLRIQFLLFTLNFFPLLAYSQNQPGLPKPTGPVDLSDTSDLIIFVIIPAVILILFLIFRKRIIKIKREKQERLRDNNEEKRKKSEK